MARVIDPGQHAHFVEECLDPYVALFCVPVRIDAHPLDHTKPVIDCVIASEVGFTESTATKAPLNLIAITDMIADSERRLAGELPIKQFIDVCRNSL
ncbi:MAG: hypothetical protein HGA19_15175 [Oscillochloris sp.]|nr:hypothetical protein [Oscillochloris sp.]